MNKDQLELLSFLLEEMFGCLQRTKEPERTLPQIACDIFEAESFLRSARFKVNEWNNRYDSDETS